MLHPGKSGNYKSRPTFPVRNAASECPSPSGASGRPFSRLLDLKRPRS
jgi:hypothetical protein